MSRRIPKRKTGKGFPIVGDDALDDRLADLETALKEIWAPDHQQSVILQNLKTYIRSANVQLKARARVALSGRCLGQVSQAGKSAIIERLICELDEAAQRRGEPTNPFRVIHLTLDEKMTLKMLYQELLFLMADIAVLETERSGTSSPQLIKAKRDIVGKGNDNIKVLEDRVRTWTKRLGVQAVVVDEIQYLGLNSNEATAITKKLQSFLDHGVVPLVLIGNEQSKQFFSTNREFAARLGVPLKLNPVNASDTRDRKRFFDFCQAYVDELLQRGLVKVAVNLTEKGVMDGLLSASTGHVGRAARIFQKSAYSAMARGADTIETFDFWQVTQEYVLTNGWTEANPFDVHGE